MELQTDFALGRFLEILECHLDNNSHDAFKYAEVLFLFAGLCHMREELKKHETPNQIPGAKEAADVLDLVFEEVPNIGIADNVSQERLRMLVDKLIDLQKELRE